MPTPSPKPFPFQHPHIPALHLGRATFKTGQISIDLGIRHNNVVMAGTPIIISRGGTNVAARVVGGIDRSLLKKGILTLKQEKADGTDAGATPAVITAGAGTFNITPGQTTKLKINGAAAVTKTWVGTQGYIQGYGATYAALNGTTLTIKVDDGANQTFTFTAMETDATTTRDKINATLTGALASIVGGQIKITSDKVGTASSVTLISGNTAAGFPNVFLSDNIVPGTGDAPNLAAVTRVEAAAALNSSGVFVGATFSGSSGNLTATSTATGSSASLQHAADTANLGWPGLDPLVNGAGGDLTIEWSCYEMDPVPIS